ncbi:MAG: pyridoxal-phosphate dependent enzyme, partial [Pseudomonadota bacterium]|nr:pyridoxal-phosphate dependent enzyme [Pseudomonadota bacterium]
RAVVKIFHYARFDLAAIAQYLGVHAAPLWCTKIASKLVRTYTDRHGLKDLCRELLDVDLSKAQQSSDWGAPDLSDAQLNYAASDVLHLHALKDRLEIMLDREGRLPDSLVACIGGGSNAMGLFHPFLDDSDIRIIGVEAGGLGLETPDHAASLAGGLPGVLHGNRTYLLQDDDGQIIEGHSISAGLDYPGIGPEHAFLRDAGRVEYVSATDAEALEAFQLITRLEGIIPALEPSHALAHVGKIAPDLPRDHLMVMNMCGRGDKDVFAVAEHLKVNL